jgi:hypothetical protein
VLVVPSERLVVVRLGLDGGDGSVAQLLADTIAAIHAHDRTASNL